MLELIKRLARRSLAIAFTLVAVTGTAAVVGDWPQWRGPTRDGFVSQTNAPRTWPNAFRQTWRVEVGEGYSSPVLSGGRLFLHSRRDAHEIVTALSVSTGKILWDHKYPAPLQKNPYASRMSQGPYATPLVVGTRLFTVGARGIVTAWDTKTGRRLWNKDFSKQVDTSKLFCGTSSSPLAINGLVVLQVGSDIHGGQVLAVDPASGSERWKWTGAGPDYASPIAIEADGNWQIVTLTDQSIVGLDAMSGGELWSIPFEDEWRENIVTPLWTGSLLIISGVRQGTHAYTLLSSSGRWKAMEVWHNPRVAMHMSSPVYGDGLIYSHSSKQRGQFVALDASSGTLRWSSDGRDADHASVLLMPRNVVFLTDRGELIVVARDGTKFEVEHRFKVGEAGIWATPIFMGRDLIVRDGTEVTRLSGGAE